MRDDLCLHHINERSCQSYTAPPAYLHQMDKSVEYQNIHSRKFTSRFVRYINILFRLKY
jgi:hypothetical protein